MGNSLSYDYAQLVRTQALPQGVQYKTTVDDERFGEIGLYEHRIPKTKSSTTDVTSIIFSKIIDNIPPHFTILRDLSAGTVKIQHPNVLSFVTPPSQLVIRECEGPTTNGKKAPGYCLLLDTWTDTLADEIIKRSNTEDPLSFTQPEILSLTSAVLEGLAYLKELGVPHGFLVPSSILFCEGHSVKIAPHSLIQGLYNLASRLDEGQTSYFPYLPPENLQRNAMSLLKTNHFQSDIYTLGMTIIHAILLKRFKNCFVQLNGEAKHRFDAAILRENLRNCEAIISPAFAQILSQMVSIESSERPDADVCLQLVKDCLATPEPAADRVSRRTAIPPKQHRLLTSQSPGPQQQPQPARPTSGERRRQLTILGGTSKTLLPRPPSMEDLGVIGGQEEAGGIHRQTFHPDSKGLHRTNSAFRFAPQLSKAAFELDVIPAIIPGSTTNCLGDGLRDKFLQGGKCPFKRNRHAVRIFFSSCVICRRTLDDMNLLHRRRRSIQHHREADTPQIRCLA